MAPIPVINRFVMALISSSKMMKNRTLGERGEVDDSYVNKIFNLDGLKLDQNSTTSMCFCNMNNNI